MGIVSTYSSISGRHHRLQRHLGQSPATYGYGPYGEPATWSGSRYRYTGQLMIPEAHLYNYKARVYDPGIGRFLQTDPAGYASDMNGYGYSSGDPVNSGDSTGLGVIGTVVTGELGGGCVTTETYSPLPLGEYLDPYSSSNPDVLKMPGISGGSSATAGISCIGVGGGCPYILPYPNFSPYPSSGSPSAIRIQHRRVKRRHRLRPRLRKSRSATVARATLNRRVRSLAARYP